MTDNAKARSVDVTLFFNTFLLFLSSSWFQLLLSLSCSRGRIPSHVCVWAMNNIYSIQRYTIILSFHTTNIEQEECFVHKVLCLSLYQKALLLFPSLQKPPHHCWSLVLFESHKAKGGFNTSMLIIQISNRTFSVRVRWPKSSQWP